MTTSFTWLEVVTTSPPLMPLKSSLHRRGKTHSQHHVWNTKCGFMHLKLYWQVHAFHYILGFLPSCSLWWSACSMVPTPVLSGPVSEPSTMSTHGVDLAAVKPRCWAPVVIFQQRHLGVWLAFYLAYVVCHGGYRKPVNLAQDLSPCLWAYLVHTKCHFLFILIWCLYSYPQQHIWIGTGVKFSGSHLCV